MNNYLVRGDYMDVIDSLKEKIQQEKEKKGRAIVFWYDPAMQVSLAELQESLKDEEVVVRELTENNFFTTKVELEIKQPKQSYLLYAPFPQPKEQHNYLLDILLYSAEFKADEVAVLAERLGVKDNVLRPMMEQYPLFFRSAKRKERLGRFVSQQSDVRDLEIAMVAVLVNSPSPTISRITRSLLVAGIEEENNKYIGDVKKYFLLERMYELIQQYFGISIQIHENPLTYILEVMLYQHVKRDALLSANSLDEQYPSTLPNVCAILVDDWMRSSEKETLVLEQYIKDTEVTFQLRPLLIEHELDQFEKVSTFPTIDYLLIEKLIDELEHDVSNVKEWQKRLLYRKGTYWGKKKHIQQLYDVLLEAVRFTDRKSFLKQYDSRSEVYGQYATSLHLIDQSYRRFMFYYTKLQSREIVDSLAQSLTNWYENVFLLKMATESNYFLENNESTHVPKQRTFFSSSIKPILDKEQTRVFVIISDALRYEAGAELSERLNKRINGQASVSPLFASLPSYTQLGMASLLPNRRFSIDKKFVYTDEHSTSGLVNRNKILQQAHPDASAYHLNDLLDWKGEANEYLKGKRLVYFYHDVIDATGDSKKSERETYDAVERALEAIERAVDRLSALQAKRIFITSDHGFLFQLTKVEADAKVEAVTGDVVDQSRRYAIGSSLSVPEGAIKLSESQTLFENAEVVLAKGVNRFKTGGGLQFIHGGAMPQEVITPLIDYRRTEMAEQVNVSVAMLDKTITNYRIPVSFYQEESISTDYVPRQLKMAFYQDDERISNEVTMTFDLVGETQERNQTIPFNLVEKYYAIGETCTLRVETIQGNKSQIYKEERFTIRMYDAIY
ncbi:BREX-1 system phosphatase PglZ type A [Halalkalibacter krulwichiae]|nr:BREX-1 system phosphatase PglZ type A [Halalkalibacter krulwichiae]